MGRLGWCAGAVLWLAGCGDIRLWNLDGDPPGPDAGARRIRPNPIPEENALPGEPRWADGQRSRQHEVDLYLSTDSASAGGSFSVRVSTSVHAEVTLEVFRLGYYGGAGA
ncbi:MAG: hypothetical protein FJ086_12580, partial [Deltaproteobacteria bacterium]|nr:hypothetical protein [Deltaproteobacteria bacterium]